MEPSIRQIHEPAPVTAPLAKPRRERDGRKPFLLPEEAAQTEEDDPVRPDGSEPESRARSASQSVGSRLDGESGSHVDVTA